MSLLCADSVEDLTTLCSSCGVVIENGQAKFNRQSYNISGKVIELVRIITVM